MISVQKSTTDEENTLVLYLIVNDSLKMSSGKIAAQCAHGAQNILMKYYQVVSANLKLIDTVQHLSDMRSWLTSNMRIVVLKSSDVKTWAKIKAEFVETKLGVIVVDAGFTEIEPGSETVIALYPMKKSGVSKIIKRLRVL